MFDKTEFKATRLFGDENIEVVEVSVRENNKAAILALRTKSTGDKNINANLAVGAEQVGFGGSYSNQQDSEWKIFCNPVTLGGLRPIENYKPEINKAVSIASGSAVPMNSEYRELKPNETLAVSGSKIASTETGSILFKKESVEQDKPVRIIGLQIGGSPNPNDAIGMFVPMPKKPGIGVKIEV